MKSCKYKSKQGAALVEFGLMALVLYLLIAGGVELGRMVFVSQTLQDAARIAARELSVTPLPPGFTFDCLPMTTTCALADPNVTATIWDPRYLVIDTTTATDAEVTACLNSMPAVNRALRPVMISDTDGDRKLLRYPGALLSVPNGPPKPALCSIAATDLTVSIPQIGSRDSATGVEQMITWVPVLSEVRGDPINPDTGPFAFSGTGAAATATVSGGIITSVTVTDGGSGYNTPPIVTFSGPSGSGASGTAVVSGGVVTAVNITSGGSAYDTTMTTVTFSTGGGIAAVAVNYPYQAAALSGFQSPFTRQGTPNFDANGAPNPNLANVIEANDATAQGNAATPPPVVVNGIEYPTSFRPLLGTPEAGPYTGPLGLGNQFAFAKTVRPYRSLLLGQAMFRREVIQ